MAALAEVQLQKTAIKCKMVFTHFSPSYVDSPKNHFVDSDYCLSALLSLSVLPNAVNRIVRHFIRLGPVATWDSVSKLVMNVAT